MVRIISEYYSTEIKGFTSSESKFKGIMIFKRQEPASRQDTKAENNVMVFKETKIKNIKEVTKSLRNVILKGKVHTMD